MATSEQLDIEVLTPSIGAIIHNFDLSQPLTTDHKHALEQALYKHRVLFFHNQKLNTGTRTEILRFNLVHHTYIHFIHIRDRILKPVLWTLVKM